MPNGEGREVMFALLSLLGMSESQFLMVRRMCRRSSAGLQALAQCLGGMTGDTCGALAELVEAAVLVALALLLS